MSSDYNLSKLKRNKGKGKFKKKKVVLLLWALWWLGKQVSVGKEVCFMRYHHLKHD
jgi:hypothetical protein